MKKRIAEIIDDRTAQIEGSRLRRTPPGQPTVDELVFLGDIIETNYSTGGRVTQISRYGTYELPVFSLIYVDLDAKPLKKGGYRENDYRWINELVAQDGRILKLFEANTDEVLLTGKTEGQSNLNRFFGR